MEEAIGTVQTIEVTIAVRSTTVGGVEIKKGQAISIVDQELTGAADTSEDAALQALKAAAGPQGSLICVYYGAGKSEADANALGRRFEAEFSEHEVEVVHGGQPHHDYIISVE
jgi:dihydroxyacetone kinase-like predicted kinase